MQTRLIRFSASLCRRWRGAPGNDLAEKSLNGAACGDMVYAQTHASGNSDTIAPQNVFVNGKPVFYKTGFGYQFSTLFDAGWICVRYVGVTSIFFLFKTDAGEELEGFCPGVFELGVDQSR